MMRTQWLRVGLVVFASCGALRAESPLAALRHSDVSDYELDLAGGGDASQAPEGLVAVLGTSRLAHFWHPLDVAFTSDGKGLVSVSDSTVRLWDPAAGEERRRFDARSAPGNASQTLHCLALSADGKRVAAAGYNNAILIWQIDRGHELAFIPVEGVGNLALDPNGNALAYAQRGPEITLRSIDGSQSRMLAGHTDAALSLAFDRSGRRLASASADKTAIVWDARSGQPLHRLEGHTDAVRDIAFSIDEHFLATASRDKTVRIWNADDGRLIRTLPAHDEEAAAVAFHPDGKTLASAGLDGKINYWNLVTGQRGLSIQAADYTGIRAITFSPDGRLLASTGRSVQLWDTASGQPRLEQQGHRGAVKSIAFSPDGGSLASAGEDKTLRIWDLATLEERQPLPPAKSRLEGLAYSPDGRTLAVLGGGLGVQLVDTERWQVRKSWPAQGKQLAYSPNGRWLLASGAGRGLALWRLPGEELHGEITTDQEAPLLGPRGEELFMFGRQGVFPPASSNSGLSLWHTADLSAGAAIENVAGLTSPGPAAATDDGRTLALCGWQHGDDDQRRAVVVLWDVPKERPRLALDQEAAGVAALAFSPDGRTLIAASNQDATIRVWDPRDGRLRETIALHTPHVFALQSVAFAPDSRHFAAAMGNGTIRIFRIAPPPAAAEFAVDPTLPVRGEPPDTDLWKALVGQPAPELANLKGWIYGEPTTLADLRGQYVMLYFWNLRSEQDMPALMALHEALGDRGLAIMVINPDYGTTVEQIRGFMNQFADQTWNGRTPRFRIALDGGGDSPIADTKLRTKGATHAAYRMLVARRGSVLPATAILIDREGMVVKSLPTSPNRGTIDELARLLGVQPRTPDWRRKVNQAYALPEGQNLRRIAPPFLPERAELLLDQPLQLREATFKFIQSGDGESLRSVWTRQHLSLSGALEFVIGLERYEFDGPDELLSREVPGDWTVREAASTARRLAALQTLLRDELMLSVRFVQREVEREVIVASGRYEFLPLPGVTDREHIHLAVEEAPNTSLLGGAGSGTLVELLRWLGGRVGRHVIDETDRAKGLDLRWRDYLVEHTLDFANRTEAGQHKLERLLFNLNQQTALQFTIEPRNVKLWFVENATSDE